MGIIDRASELRAAERYARALKKQESTTPEAEALALDWRRYFSGAGGAPVSREHLRPGTPLFLRREPRLRLRGDPVRCSSHSRYCVRAQLYIH